MTISMIDSRALETLRSMVVGSPRTNARIIEDLAALALDDEGPLVASELLCELVTRRPYVHVVTRLSGGPLLRHIRQDKRAGNGPLNRAWLGALRRKGLAARLLERYRQGYGSAQALVHELNAERPRIVDLDGLLNNALIDLRDPSASELEDKKKCRSWLDELIDERGLLRDWCADKRAQGVQLHELGGLTQTVIGGYDWIADPQHATGWDRLPRDADVLVDLGGGYATADVSRLFGAQLTSHDLQPPGRADELGLRRFRVADGRLQDAPHLLAATRWQSDEEAADYARQRRGTPFVLDDIFEGAFDERQHKFTIVSFGFAGTVAPSASPRAASADALGPGGLGPMFTVLVAARRTLALAAKGKDVSLFWYPRGSRIAQLNVTIMLRFDRGRLVDHALYTDPYPVAEPLGARVRE